MRLLRSAPRACELNWGLEATAVRLGPLLRVGPMDIELGPRTKAAPVRAEPYRVPSAAK